MYCISIIYYILIILYYNKYYTEYYKVIYGIDNYYIVLCILLDRII
jgi:hypothetical protein